LGIEASARAVGVCDRELRRRSARHGLPEPRALQRWSRILLALGLGRIGVTQGARIARHLGYEDASSVYRLFRDLVSRAPGNVLGDVDEEGNVLRRFLSGL
jgi:AraC-like DNA-binding protein